MRGLILLAGVVCSTASYPSTYPFENEAFVPVNTLAATPNLAYDDSDEGGYIYHYYARAEFTLTQDDFESPTLFGEDYNGWSPTQSGAIRFLLVVHFGAPPDLAASVWNCTLVGVFSEEAFTGKVNGQTVCNVGECCAGIMGLPKYSDDQLDWHTTIDARTAAGMCGDMEEEMYCVAVGGDFQSNCIEYYLSPSERLFTFICNDSYSLYFLSCPVFLTAFTPVYAAFEPAVYYNACSQEEYISSDAQYFAGDRVCHPYSYYHPESIVASASLSASDAASGSGSSASEESSSTLLLGSLVLMAV